jgi:cell division protease FtsH
VVARTEGVSASFIKELLRRAAILAGEEADELVVTDRHVPAALDEFLVYGGVLTLRLLGGEAPPEPGPGTVPPGWFGGEPPGSP